MGLLGAFKNAVTGVKKTFQRGDLDLCANAVAIAIQADGKVEESEIINAIRTMRTFDELSSFSFEDLNKSVRLGVSQVDNAGIEISLMQLRDKAELSDNSFCRFVLAACRRIVEGDDSKATRDVIDKIKTSLLV